ncbi:MAG: hypothetical protein ABI895_32415, partial [Deltaproteobacteria bacterium]
MTLFEFTVPVGDGRGKQRIGSPPNLLGRAVVQSEAAGATADVDAQGQPRGAGLVDALPFVATEEQIALARFAESPDEPKLGGAEVLAFIDDDVLV